MEIVSDINGDSIWITIKVNGSSQRYYFGNQNNNWGFYNQADNSAYGGGDKSINALQNTLTIFANMSTDSKGAGVAGQRFNDMLTSGVQHNVLIGDANSGGQVVKNGDGDIVSTPLIFQLTFQTTPIVEFLEITVRISRQYLDENFSVKLTCKVKELTF